MKIQNQQSISKIYSRKRLRGFKPKKYNWKNNNRKKSKYICVFIILIIIIIVNVVVTRSIEPIFRKVALNEVKSIATKIINDDSSKAIENYQYSDLYTIEKNSNRKYSNDKC